MEKDKIEMDKYNKLNPQETKAQTVQKDKEVKVEQKRGKSKGKKGGKKGKK